MNVWSFSGLARDERRMSCSCPFSTEKHWGDCWPWKSSVTSSRQTLKPGSPCTLTTSQLYLKTVCRTKGNSAHGSWLKFRISFLLWKISIDKGERCFSQTLCRAFADQRKVGTTLRYQARSPHYFDTYQKKYERPRRSDCTQGRTQEVSLKFCINGEGKRVCWHHQ